MGPIPRNILANIAGQGWMALMAVLLVPLYIRLIGVEAFGLIGVYGTLQASLQLLDLGLSQTMNRQMAYYVAFPEKAGEARDFVRTVEVGYWALGVCIGGGVVLAAPALATHWLRVGALPVGTVEHAIRIMGLVVALQWPLSLYDGGLTGLHRQVLLNVLRIGLATLTAAGSALVLWLWSPTVTAYFGWQIVATAVGLVAVAGSLWRSMPPSGRAARFDLRLVRSHWRLAAGMGGVAVTGLVLAQLDKVVLSKLLPLETFGYYTVAAMVSGAIPLLIGGPVFNGIFPQLTGFAAAGSESEVAQLYHRGTQLMVVLVAPIAGVIGAFAFEILSIWTRSAPTASTAAPILTVLVVGSALNAVLTLPYALQLAHGWTALWLRVNLGLMALVVPTIVLLATRFGAVGAAGAWIVLNGVNLLVAVPLMHRRLLRGHLRAWIVGDILPPACAGLLTVAAGRLVVRPQTTAIVTVVSVAAVLVAALVAGALSAPLVRRAAVELVRARRRGVR